MNITSTSKVRLNGIELPQECVEFRHTNRGRAHMTLTLQHMELEIVVRLPNAEGEERYEVTGVLVDARIYGVIANGKCATIVNSDYEDVTQEWQNNMKMLSNGQNKSGVTGQTNNEANSYNKLASLLKNLPRNSTP